MGCGQSSLAADKTDRRKKQPQRKPSPKRSPSKSPSKSPSGSRRHSSPPKRSSSGSRDNKSIQRLLSANSGSVFRLPGDAQKGVETRLRRLSAPAIPPGLTAEDLKRAEEAAARKDAAKRSSSKEQQQQQQTAEQSGTAAEPAAVAADTRQPPAAVAPVPPASLAAAERREVAESESQSDAGGSSDGGGGQPAVAGQPQVNGSSTRVRRMSVVGTPGVDEDAVSSAESTQESMQEGAGDSPLMMSPMFRNAYTMSRSRSLQLRNLEDFNLMEHCIHSVASLSRAGREPSFRKTNQDNCFAYQQYLHPSQALFGAMDGHGPNGHKVSSFIKKQFPIILAKQQETEDDNAVALSKAFVAMQEALVESSVDCEFSGSTAVACFLHGRQLTTAWVGDSRAVLARQEHRGLRGIHLTRDHKPASHQEKLRIQAAGGRVERLLDSSGKPIGPHRVWLTNAWVPGLAMSRALGDTVAHSVGVSAVPDTDVTNITPQDRFLVVATDGVWEFITSQVAVELIAGCTSAEQACRILVDAATERWMEEEEGVIDDITVVVVKFK